MRRAWRTDLHEVLQLCAMVDVLVALAGTETQQTNVAGADTASKNRQTNSPATPEHTENRQTNASTGDPRVHHPAPQRRHEGIDRAERDHRHPTQGTGVNVADGPVCIMRQRID